MFGAQRLTSRREQCIDGWAMTMYNSDMAKVQWGRSKTAGALVFLAHLDQGDELYDYRETWLGIPKDDDELWEWDEDE